MTSRIQTYLRASAPRGRETERIGPFLATFSRSNPNPFLSYAIPDEGATPTVPEVQRLIEAYTRRGLKPRLEYIIAEAPAVEAMLLAAGFEVEGRVAVMTCHSQNLPDLPIPQGIELLKPYTDRELLDARSVQHEAYGETEPPDEKDIRSLRANLEAGSMAVLARVRETGEPAGAGEYIVPEDGFTEIAGVAVRAAFRRRGLAAAMTVWLARAAFEAGVTDPFLTAYDAEERVYERAGFRTTDTMLHISKPAMS